VLKNIFGRSKGRRGIDFLIRDIADHQRPEDYAEFFRLLPELQLFLPIVGSLPAGIPRGDPIVIQAGTEINVRTASVQGLECVLVFTSSDHPNLGADHAGIEGREALRMVMRMPMVGLLVQSRGTGWVGLDREKVADVFSVA
jgi:hypothetical protein